MSAGHRVVHRWPQGVAAVAIMLVLASCLGPTSSEQRQVGSFTALSASNGVEVHVTVGPAPSVTVTAAESVLPHVTTRVDGDRLEVGLDGSRHRVTVEVTAPSLAEVGASSSAKVVAEGVAAQTFAVNVSSQATIEVSGTAETLALDASSQSTAKLGELRATTAHVNLSSQSSAEVQASSSVTGDVSSQAKLTVLGSPSQVDVSTSSGGSVVRR